MGPGSERKYDTYAYRFVTQFNCYKHFFDSLPIVALHFLSVFSKS